MSSRPVESFGDRSNELENGLNVDLLRICPVTPGIGDFLPTRRPLVLQLARAPCRARASCIQHRTFHMRDFTVDSVRHRLQAKEFYCTGDTGGEAWAIRPCDGGDGPEAGRTQGGYGGVRAGIHAF